MKVKDLKEFLEAFVDDTEVLYGYLGIPLKLVYHAPKDKEPAWIGVEHD